MFKGSARARHRVQFTLPHYMAAAEYARAVIQIERENHGAPFGPFWDRITRSAISCVLSLAAGLESHVNELFVDRAQTFPSLDSKLMDELWRSYERESILFKYKVALRLRTGSDHLILSRYPGQAVDLLIDLRNALVHFKPEWSDESDEHSDLSDRMRHKFTPSPWLSTEQLFPRAWQSASCMRWALRACLDFTEEFEKLAQLSERHPIRRTLEPVITA